MKNKIESLKKYLILSGTLVREALEKIEALGGNLLFVVNRDNVLIGSVSDGDIRRGLIFGHGMETVVDHFCEKSPKTLLYGEFDIEELIDLRENKYEVIPVIDSYNKIIDLINFDILKSYLPVDVVIMAGGRGKRLTPLTDTTPKPMLKVGEKPIIEHNIDYLIRFGVNNFWISINYLGEQIIDYFGEGNLKNVNINYVKENKPLGTIGAVSEIVNFTKKYILVTNSDLLTDINYEDFFVKFLRSDADICVASIPYSINIPYAVLETEDIKILDFNEKPTYEYYINSGIYLIKREVIELIPRGVFYNATDLIAKSIEKGLKVHSYVTRNYWLDIGKSADFQKAQEDIRELIF